MYTQHNYVNYLKRNFFHIKYITPLAVVLFFASCSTKKNTFTTRTYHSTTTKFNGYFNGNESLNEGIRLLEQAHKDDFNEIIPVYKLGNEQDAVSVAPQMDRAIEKAVKVIKKHSIRIRGKEYNNMIDESYLLMGKAQFYKKDYIVALEAFNYVAKEYKEQPAYYEATLWAANCYLEMNSPIAALEQLDRLYQNRKLPKSLTERVTVAQARYHILKKEYQEAVELLVEAEKIGKKKKNRIRYLYIIAQLKEALGEADEASQYYLKVVKARPSYELEFNARISRARTFDIYLNDSREIKEELNKMLKDDKNIEYHDQIYYALAGIELKEDNIDEAITYLKLSAKTSISNDNQKALSYNTLADLHFEFSEYVPASAYYDSTLSFMSEENKSYALVKKKKESLEELVKYVQTIELQDSLVTLGEMAGSERDRVLEEYIEKLKKEDKRKKAEEERQAELLTPGSNVGTRGGDSQGAWYFYNQTTLSFGFTEFRRVWGNRKLEDNWRRKNKQIELTENIVAEEGSQGEEGSIDGEDGEGSAENDKYSKEYYLKDIPLTEEDITLAKEMIQEAYYKLGIIYRENLKDYREAVETFETLNKKYPETSYLLPSYYNLYRSFLALELPKDADKYKALILENYPSSKFAAIINSDGKPLEDKEADEAEQYYRLTYDYFTKGKNKDVIKRADKAIEQYPTSSLLPNFALLKAIAIGKTKTKEDYIVSLKDVITNYPSTEVSASAQEMLDAIKTDKEQAKTEAATEKFVYNEKARHLYVVLFPMNKGDLAKITASYSDFNSRYFQYDRLTVKNTLLGKNYQMVVVRNFKNQKAADKFFSAIRSNPKVLSNFDNIKYDHFIISDANYKTLFLEQDLDLYLEFFKQKYK